MSNVVDHLGHGLEPIKLEPHRIRPSHRHANPSAPWPWLDTGDVVDQVQLDKTLALVPQPCSHIDCECWAGCPHSQFPNWTKLQVMRSKIWDAIHIYDSATACTIHRCDMDTTSGQFSDAGPLPALEGHDGESWRAIINDLTQRPTNVTLRALFVEHMSGPVLQMLGAKSKIEPFFFSSSLNWIPSRFQEDIWEDAGDHVTITLPFIKAMSETEFTRRATVVEDTDFRSMAAKSGTLLGSQRNDTEAPFLIYSISTVLALDLLSVHLVRNIKGSTLISYHPSLSIPTTTAPFLHGRVRFASQSAHWKKIFRTSPDPTLVLLCLIWHVVYSWDEALESLYDHILYLEDVFMSKARMPLARELHIMRAHHQRYASLLDDFVKSIHFLRSAPTPFMTQKNFDRDHCLSLSSLYG
ncbi:hypothetical protein D9611_009225 [Ephemerocybe angulata]|uniref:Uncharacterized protein n=1 Tax=Ephemerocybe angulata TaxID=980116 RepID=A0A8H5BGP7_9AGAR|nr:hypothetical protein D9611_009225 [Tulosesus angulatus]